jgi:DNA-binding response OmpR family regulator
MAKFTKDARIYLAIKSPKDRSHVEDTLVLDGFDVSTFATATELWEVFQSRPARVVISERRFGSGLSGLDLAANIRKDFLLPYCFIVVMSTMNRMKEIEAGLAAGVDDYLIRPYNQSQIRSRILVGLRWLAYIDSLHAGKGTALQEPAKP